MAYIYVPMILTSKKEEFFGAFDKEGFKKFIREFKKEHGQWSLCYTSDHPEDPKAPCRFWKRVRAYDFDGAELRVLYFPLNKKSNGYQMAYPLGRRRRRS